MLRDAGFDQVIGEDRTWQVSSCPFAALLACQQPHSWFCTSALSSAVTLATEAAELSQGQR